MKEVSTLVMEWVNYLGGVDILWVALVSVVGTQLAALLSVAERSQILFRLVPYVLGALTGYTMLAQDASGALIGVAVGMVAAMARSALLFWLLREAALPWMRSLGKYMSGYTGA